MAGKSGKKGQAQTKTFDEFDDDADSFDDDVPNINEKDEPPPAVRARDWRDVEKYREMRELKKLVGDDLDLLMDEPLEQSGGPRKKKKR